MNKSQKIFIGVFGAVVAVLGLILTIFCVPNMIPVLYDTSEKVLLTASKWWLVLLLILPIVFASLCICVKNKNAQSIFKDLFLISIYEMMLCFVCLLSSKNLAVGDTADVSLTCFIFLPLSLLMMMIAGTLKNLPYKSKFGIKFKCSSETEFIWKQTHFFAHKAFLLTGLILLVASAIFSFFHLTLVVLGIFVVAILVCFIVIFGYSNSIYKKYLEMKAKRDKIEEDMAKKAEQK